MRKYIVILVALLVMPNIALAVIGGFEDDLAMDATFVAASGVSFEEIVRQQIAPVLESSLGNVLTAAGVPAVTADAISGAILDHYDTEATTSVQDLVDMIKENKVSDLNTELNKIFDVDVEAGKSIDVTQGNGVIGKLTVNLKSDDEFTNLDHQLNAAPEGSINGDEAFGDVSKEWNVVTSGGKEQLAIRMLKAHNPTLTDEQIKDTSKTVEKQLDKLFGSQEYSENVMALLGAAL